MKPILQILLLAVCFTASSTLQLNAQRTTDTPIQINSTQLIQTLSKAGIQRVVPVVLPTIEGDKLNFSAIYKPLYGPDFEQRFPNLRTYFFSSDTEPVNGFIVSDGIHVTLTYHSPQGNYLLKKDSTSEDGYYFDMMTASDLSLIECGVTEEHDHDHDHAQPENALFSFGATNREYEMALVVTSEYYEDNGDDTVAVTNEINIALAALNTIYNNEMAVSFIHAVGSPVLYNDVANDPFIPDNQGGNSRTTQAVDAVAMNFNSSVYDVGHVLHHHQNGDGWSTGGVAGLSVVCRNNSSGTVTDGRRKARGWSGSFNNQTNSFYGLFAHEIGHMFGASHTFNAGDNNGNCENNISSNNSYEVASGVTIMSYRGICNEANQNVPFSLPAYNYFHTHSQTQMNDYITTSTGGNCDNPIASGNTPPTATANPCGGSLDVPKATPFTLTGSGTDPDADPLTYLWEQYDEDGAGTPTQGDLGSDAADNTIGPVFRNYLPTNTPDRTFPDPALIAANEYLSNHEPLPTVARTVNMRLTVRDNSPTGTGGISTDLVGISITNDGPLTVSIPNGSELYAPGEDVTVTWVVNGTNAISADVNILLSLDGGNTYGITLASSTPNDGSQDVTIPASTASTTQARIKVEAVVNACLTFFDISDDDFEIDAPNCTVANSTIADAGAVSYYSASPLLDFDPIVITDVTINSLSFDIISADPDMSDTYFNSSQTACQIFSGTDNYQTYKFYTDNGGTLNGSFNTFRQVNTYAGEFDVSNTCDNFLHSTRVASVGRYNGFQPPRPILSSNSINELVVANGGSGNTTITFSGGVNIYPLFTSPSNTGYTFAAVNSATGVIVDVDENADFTTIANGDYCLYGLNFKNNGPGPPNNVDPATLIGQTLANAEANNCLIASTNCKPFSVVDAPNAFINEIHYENTGTDVGEFVEVLVSKSSPCSGTLELYHYDGNTGEVLQSVNVIASNQCTSADTIDGFTIYAVDMPGLQDNTEGLALVCDGNVIQFLSYEGSFLGADGPASSYQSEDIGVSESSSTPVGFSLQLTGIQGEVYSDFTWDGPFAETPCAQNQTQFVLPVDWLSFEAKKSVGAVNLEWVVNELSGTDYFVVEHSIDGKNWSMLKNIPAIGGNQIINTYSYTHAQNLSSLNYYRIAQYDTDGKYSYSDIRAVAFNEFSASSVFIYPNPVTSTLYFEWPESQADEETDILILNMNGQIVLSYTGNTPNNIDVSSLPSGSYACKIITQSHTKILRFNKTGK